MLTKQQAKELGGFDAEQEAEVDRQLGPKCVWRNTARESISMTLLKGQPLGIAGIYRNNQKDPLSYKYFEPVDVAGVPRCV